MVMTGKVMPCIGVCQLNLNKVCVGCNRTIEEIREAYEKIIRKKEVVHERRKTLF